MSAVWVIIAVIYVVARVRNSIDNEETRDNGGGIVYLIIHDAATIVISGNAMENSHFHRTHFEFITYLLLFNFLCSNRCPRVHINCNMLLWITGRHQTISIGKPKNGR